MKPSLETVHPELRKPASMWPSFPMESRNLWLWRLLMRLSPPTKPAADLLVETIHIPAGQPANQMRLRVYRPTHQTTPLPMLLWLHGGGYVIGRPEMDDAICMEYAREANLLVVAPDYRLAPENPFPAALNDGYTTLNWMIANAARFNADPKKVAIGGNSAGGGLAAALCQFCLDRGEIKPAFQLLVYPMLDDQSSSKATAPDSAHFVWDHPSNRFGWASYLGPSAADERSPAYAVPARRADLTGLPAAWIGVGNLDLFHTEDMLYAHRLQTAGIDCQTLVVTGGFHGFDVTAPTADITREFRRAQISALCRALQE
jgi:acetyl esterase/lipase